MNPFRWIWETYKRREERHARKIAESFCEYVEAIEAEDAIKRVKIRDAFAAYFFAKQRHPACLAWEQLSEQTREMWRKEHADPLLKLFDLYHDK